MIEGERYFSHMRSREITWHNWQVPQQQTQPQTEGDALEVIMGIMVNLGDQQAEVLLFEQEGVSKKDYVGTASSNPQK